MSNFKKSREALSVIQSELDILMCELAPGDWASLSSCVDKLNSCFDQLEAEYSEDE